MASYEEAGVIADVFNVDWGCTLRDVVEFALWRERWPEDEAVRERKRGCVTPVAGVKICWLAPNPTELWYPRPWKVSSVGMAIEVRVGEDHVRRGERGGIGGEVVRKIDGCLSERDLMIGWFMGNVDPGDAITAPI